MGVPFDNQPTQLTKLSLKKAVHDDSIPVDSLLMELDHVSESVIDSLLQAIQVILIDELALVKL